MALTTHGRFIFNYFLNFSSAILLIYISKWIFLQYPISSLVLTIFNCLFSALFASIALKFLSKTLTNPQPAANRLKSLFRIFLISGSFSSFITFSNLSLQYNTIGTYQLIKLQVPPTLMLIEWIELQLGLNSSILTKEKFHRDYSLSVLFAFGIIVFGTLLNTYSDLYFHPLGVAYACISVVCNALYQALVQGDKASSNYERTRFLQIQTMISGLILFPCWPLIDSPFKFKWYLFSQSTVLILLFISGLLAFLVNSSVIWCIKDDAAIGYNMIGQLKTLLIVFIGSTLFGEVLTIKQIVSILFTTIGCLIYVYITYQTKERQKIQQQLLINNIS
jgi:solute carrier family 35 protein E3